MSSEPETADVDSAPAATAPAGTPPPADPVVAGADADDADRAVASGPGASDAPASGPSGPGPGPQSGPRRVSTARPETRFLAAEDRPLTRGELAFYQFARALVSMLAQLFWRIRVEGRENIPPDGPFVLAPVHRSNVDTILMACMTRRQLRYMAKDSLWKHGWSARLLSALGGFPVNRETADREALRTCETALRRGEPVVIFPEGTRKEGPVVTDLFEGAAFVALRGGVPIVPVGIGGSARAMPRGAKYLRPAKIRIVIGVPIQPPPRTKAGGRGSRRQVHELTEQLQRELQRLFDQVEGR